VSASHTEHQETHGVNPLPRRAKTWAKPEFKPKAGAGAKPEAKPRASAAAKSGARTRAESGRSAGTPVDGRPRYLQISAELTAAIASGRYPVGSRLPTELELCERFGISRFTAREAVRVLSSAGLVTRRQRAGTVVIATPDEARYTHDAASVPDLFQYALDTELRLLFIGKVALDRERSRQFGGAVGDEWVYAIGIRLEPGDGLASTDRAGSAGGSASKATGRSNAGGSPTSPTGATSSGAARGSRPISLTRLFLNPALEGIEAKLRGRRTAVYALIEREYKVSIERVEQDIQGAVLDAEDAHNLCAQAGEPALRIVRRYFDADDRLLEVAENIHPADRFTYRMHLRK
jgi:GntR family transcriptional regulator